MKVYRWTGLSRDLTYDEFLALWLNVETTAATNNFHNAVAGSVARGGHKLPHHWIRAAVGGESEANDWRNWDTMRLMGE